MNPYLIALLLVIVGPILWTGIGIWWRRRHPIVGRGTGFSLDDDAADYDPLYHLRNDNTRDLYWQPPAAVDPWSSHHV